MAVDTHKAVKKLKEVGFDEAQAEAVVRMVGEAFDDSVATKADIVTVRADLSTQGAEVRGEIQEVRTDLSTQGAELRAEIQEVRGEIREVRGEIQEVRTDLSTQGAELHGEIREVRGELRAEAKAIRAELRELEQRMTIKLGGLLVLALTLLTAINKWLG